MVVNVGQINLSLVVTIDCKQNKQIYKENMIQNIKIKAFSYVQVCLFPLVSLGLYSYMSSVKNYNFINSQGLPNSTG